MPSYSLLKEIIDIPTFKFSKPRAQKTKKTTAKLQAEIFKFLSHAFISRPASLYSTVTGLVITFLASKSFLCIINFIGALMFYVLSLRLSVTDWIIFSSLFPVPLHPLPFLFPLPQSVGASCGTFILSLHRPPFVTLTQRARRSFKRWYSGRFLNQNWNYISAPILHN